MFRFPVSVQIRSIPTLNSVLSRILFKEKSILGHFNCSIHEGYMLPPCSYFICKDKYFPLYVFFFRQGLFRFRVTPFVAIQNSDLLLEKTET